MEVHKLRGIDIITLNTIATKPVLVSDIEKVVTGGSSSLSSFDYNIEESRGRLYTAGLIRENKPKEFLKYFTIDDLKKILKKHAFVVSGLSQKTSFIDEVERIIPDEVIISQAKYKSFYVVTEEGSKALEKYANVTWFHHNKLKIFGFQEGNNRFNVDYFFKEYDKNPADLLIDYYASRDQRITGRLYSLKEDYATAIIYATNTYTVNFNNLIERLIDNPYNRDKDRAIYFLKENDSEWIDSVYKQVFEKEKLIDTSIEESYNKLFKYRDFVTKNLFTNIIKTLLQNENYDLKEYVLELIDIVDEKYPNEPVYDEISEKRYRESILNQAALLDLLVDHLDLELLEQLKERVELRIEEWKSI